MICVLRGGKIEAIYRKMDLPNYSVFDDKRYFDHGNAACVFEVGGLRVGVLDVQMPDGSQAHFGPGGEGHPREALRILDEKSGTGAKTRLPS